VVYSGASEVRNINALFVILGWDRYRFHKKHIRARYAELGLLHLVGSAGHIVQSSAFRSQNVDTLFFMLVW
jgi:uncharacterized membrane protein YsdA (DUF1294 family)